MEGARGRVQVMACLVGVLCAVGQAAPTSDPHGGVVMGNANNNCDDAKTNLNVDWDNSTDFEYTCQPYESILPEYRFESTVECIPKEQMPQPLHKCMNTPIFYNDQPPRAGPHRPLWPVYGEYVYVPPQRWIHTLEHGGAVFLYHPCARPEQIELLKSLARTCLRKHVVTPYRKMPVYQNFGVVTYGCRLLMGHVDPNSVIEYVKKYALKAPEHTPRDGQYSIGLLHKAALVTDLKDSGGVCPRSPSSYTREFQQNRHKLQNAVETLDMLQQRLGKKVIM